LLWGLRAASREIRRWQSSARLIPDVPIREDALQTLERKRTHIVGAGLFWILPDQRDMRLLRLLIAYEIILEFLDEAHERAGGERNGRQLHRALIEALDPTAPISDYYSAHPWSNDGGYLRTLVEACREGCASLSFYADVRELLLQNARRCAQAQGLNHRLTPAERGDGLRAWAESEFRGELHASWWEMTAAASSSVGVHALLALAACSQRHDWDQVNAAYVPWICAVSTLLDSYADQLRDAAEDSHSYLAYYTTPEVATERLAELIRRAALAACGLEHGERHAVIAASMIAMYLSNEAVRAPDKRAGTARLTHAGGTLTRVLLPALRLWRIAYAQRSS
jgi:tetraprenyl-beta-curcumene synthase